jgi:predicted phage-related endonuclease
MIERRTITSEEEWLAWRREALNASEIGACGGYHPDRSLAQIVVIKRGLDLGPDPLTPMLVRGHDLEKVAAELVGRKFPQWKITKNDDYFIDRERRLGATPDYFAIDPDRVGFGCLQIKVVAEPIFKRIWKEDNNVPLWIALQVQQEMLLTGASWGMVAVLPLGAFRWDVVTYPIALHEGAHARIIEMAEKFWREFDAGIDPEIDYARDSALIGLLFPHHVPDSVLDLTGDNAIRGLLDKREMLDAMIKDAEKRVEAVENEIKGKIGHYESALVDGWRVTWKEQHRKGYTKVIEPTSFRVLRATRTNPKDDVIRTVRAIIDGTIASDLEESKTR